MCAQSLIVIGSPRPIWNVRGGSLTRSFTVSSPQDSLRSSPLPVRDQEVVDHPGVAALHPDIAVSERLGDLEEPFARDADPGTELRDVFVRSLVATFANHRDRLIASHPTVAN